MTDEHEAAGKMDVTESVGCPDDDTSARGRKGPLAFRTISEVADELKVPQHVLRFWEARFEQVRPLKRGGGRRYYRPEDIELLRSISDLLYVKGYTIRGVQRVLREGEPGEENGTGVGETQPVAAFAEPIAPVLECAASEAMVQEAVADAEEERIAVVETTEAVPFLRAEDPVVTSMETVSADPESASSPASSDAHLADVSAENRKLRALLADVFAELTALRAQLTA